MAETAAPTTYHPIRETSFVSCDECGAAVSTSERDRVLHSEWHAARNRAVVELAREEAKKVLDLAS